MRSAPLHGQDNDALQMRALYQISGTNPLSPPFHGLEYPNMARRDPVTGVFHSTGAKATPEDLSQGTYGNCWWIACLQAVAEFDPERIVNMIPLPSPFLNSFEVNFPQFPGGPLSCKARVGLANLREIWDKLNKRKLVVSNRVRWGNEGKVLETESAYTLFNQVARYPRIGHEGFALHSQLCG